jgi:hypothetical protein
MERNGEKMMKRTGFSLAILVALGLLASCTDNRATFFVRDIKIPTDDCYIQADRNAPYRSSGTLDVALRDNYLISPLMENAMTSSLPLSPTTAESNRIQITGAQVRLNSEDGSDISGGSFFIPTSALVEPGNVIGVTFEGIPSGYADGVVEGTIVIIEFRMMGTTQGGQDVDTPWFAYPVYVCHGCLITFPPEAWDEDLGCYDCNSIGSGGSIEEPCFPGQDDYVDCRLCASVAPGLCTDPTCG